MKNLPDGGNNGFGANASLKKTDDLKNLLS
jgi:hypothetical protein